MENKDKFTYFLIILLGVLAFFLSTFFFPRVRSAEAATLSSANSSKITSDLPSLSDFREVFAANGYDVGLNVDNSVIFLMGDYYNFYYFSDSSFSDSGYYLSTYSFTHSYELHVNHAITVTYNPSSGEFKFFPLSSPTSSFSYDIAQYGYVWGKLPSKNQYYVEAVFSYPGKASIHFDPNAPYLDIDNVFYTNKIYTNPGTRDTDSSFYKFRFKLFGDFSKSSVAKMKFSVRLPSVSFFNEFLQYAFFETESDATTRKDRLFKWRRRTVTDETNLVFEFDYDWSFKHVVYNTDTGTMLLSLTFEEILEKIEEKYGSLVEIYGLSGSQKLIEKQRVELAMYLTIQKVVCAVYDLEANIYGPCTVIEFFLGDPSFYASEVTIVDYFADDSDIASVVADSIDSKFKDKYAEQVKEHEEMRQYIDNMNALQGAFDGNLDTTSLWTSFKSTVTGLFSLITILPQISYIVGIAFGFLPLPVSSLILSVFLVVLIAAIIRAIRG